MDSETSRFIKDPVHDMIPITPTMAKFIDSAPFQRLRNIKQLGTTYYVWAGASHNRFEHCIGVAHLARLMVTGLQKRQPELKISDRDVECVTLAGLCHDLGHGPWSHLWDGMLIPSILPDSNWTHEQGSEMMLDFLISTKEIDISVEDIRFIKALIAGEYDRCNEEKRFLFDVVANKRNGLDVDKFDYIQRDSLAIGDPIKLQISRLIKSARVINQEVCYEYKDLDKVFEVFQTRHKLHKTWYNHKTAKAIEYMIIDALKVAEPHLKIAEKIRDPEAFLWLTDDLMQEIQKSRDPNLVPAQQIFDRITNRKLYKCVDKKWVKWEERKTYRQLVTEHRVLECAREAYDQLPKGDRKEMDLAWAADGLSIDKLTVDDIVVEHCTMHYGMREKNPLDFVKFYSKLKPDESYVANDGDYSTLRPFVFLEVLLRIFTKKPQFHGIIQLGYRRIPDLESPQSPSDTVAVDVAEGGKPIVDNAELSFMGDSDTPMSPPATERGLPDDSDILTELSLSQPLSRNVSLMSVGHATSTTISTAATQASLALSPDIPNISPASTTPGPRISAPTSRKASGSRITTENRFTTVAANHGSPIQHISRKRDWDEVVVDDALMIASGTASTVRKTRSSTRIVMLPGDRESSPSPVPRKIQRQG